MASNPTRALFVSSEFGKSAIELCVSWLTPQRQLLKPRLSSHTTAHAVRVPRYVPLPAHSEPSPRLHVGELEQLEKDLEKRRALPAREAHGVLASGGGIARASARVEATPLLLSAAHSVLWLGCARTQYHSGPRQCCETQRTDLFEKVVSF